MSDVTPARNLNELWDVFDPANAIKPDSNLYIPRAEDGLRRLTFALECNKQAFQSFLCGHVGSGKTTELLRLSQDEDICEKYLPIYVSVNDFKIEHVNLTHDALLVEMALGMLAQTDKTQLNRSFVKRLDDWGKTVIDTLIHDEGIKAEVGVKGSAWFAYFKAQLSSRDSWQHQEKLLLEPKVQDLIDLINQMAVDFNNNTGKRFLLMIDDLEKGESDADKAMHHRLFNEYYGVLTQPQLTIIYTLPVYFKGLPAKRIDDEKMFSFSSVRIYDIAAKKESCPPLDKDGEGYKLMLAFIRSRVDDVDSLFAPDTLDELIRIGGGLFRDTARMLRDAAYYALMRKAQKVENEDVSNVFNRVKKDYQPLIRGDAINILKQVAECDGGWVKDVEPYLQSGAVVEYENGDIWLDVRYPLKAYLQRIDG